MEPLVSPETFVGLEGVKHLCAGAESPWLKAHEQVYLEFSKLKSAGWSGRREICAYGKRCREKVGRLWDVPPQRIVMMPSSAEGMNWLARGLDWRAGDNVVTTDIDDDRF